MQKDRFIEYLIQNMSEEEKIGQLLMIDYRKITSLNVELEKILDKYKPTGFVIFGDNISNFDETKRFIGDLQDISDMPMFISTDQEGGKVQRFKENVGFERIPPMLEVARDYSVEEVMALGEKIGEELKQLGVNMDMAPVLDIFSNQENTVIGDRAFGKDSDMVTRMGVSMSHGLINSGVVPVGKHFPGHGDTAKNSHIDLSVVNKCEEELMNFELIPFKKAIESGLPAVMVGHIAVPEINQGDLTPASLSEYAINGILRDKLGHTGIVMPDSLKMKGVTKLFDDMDKDKMYLRCLQAGNDILLMPENIELAYKTIHEAIDSGSIKDEQIDKSVRRILSVKFDFGLLDKQYEEYKNALAQVRR